MKIQSTDIKFSPISEKLNKECRSLFFSGSLEEEFRHYYSQSSVSRSRLMPIFTIIMTVIVTLWHMSGEHSHTIEMVFDLGILLPLLVVTLFVSTRPDRYRGYQMLLALTGLISGIVIVSWLYRPELPDLPSYFPIETAWIFAIWLILGLRFRVAAIVALSVSASHLYWVFSYGYGIRQAGFAIEILLLINAISAIACYHLEYAVRMGFLESRELLCLAKELGRLVQMDGLTGLHNRRSHDKHIELVWHQSRREQVPLAILLIDIDHFKAYNDHYGHQQGDDALITVAHSIAASVRRPLDLAARYGGEEFIMTLYGQDGDPGYKIAKSICNAISELKIPHAKSPTDKYLSVSIGVGVIMPDTDHSMAGAVQIADEALYQAKQAGRNRVVVRSSGTMSLITGKFRVERVATCTATDNATAKIEHNTDKAEII